MRARPRRGHLVLSLACAVLAIGATTVGATNVVGTAGNDKLRGSGGVDKLNGLAGNDKLYGLAGNDVLTGGPGNDMLVGGPGADALRCGPGKDTASGDAKDKVAKDCEVVKGIPAVAPPPPPPPPSAAPAAAPGCAGDRRLLPGPDTERELRLPDGVGRSDLHRTEGERPSGTV